MNSIPAQRPSWGSMAGPLGREQPLLQTMPGRVPAQFGLGRQTSPKAPTLRPRHTTTPSAHVSMWTTLSWARHSRHKRLQIRRSIGTIMFNPMGLGAYKLRAYCPRSGRALAQAIAFHTRTRLTPSTSPKFRSIVGSTVLSTMTKFTSCLLLIATVCIMVVAVAPHKRTPRIRNFPNSTATHCC